MVNVFVDTSFFKALVDNKDDFHLKAVKIWENLSHEKPLLVTTNYVLDEVFTLIRTRGGLKKVDQFRQFLAQAGSEIKIVRIAVNDEAMAWDWFLKNWSGLSFTDCVSFAVMNRLGITKVLTFDDHFSRAGFKVIS